ncbi:MAG: hypothetical protein QNK22_00395 [Xanthomonadales bacterium]|nr:hypothetical protein [Xanthomonadales bacterium]
MKYTIAVAMVCSLLGACASDRVGVDAPTGLDAGNGMAVTMDEFRRLEGDNWEGSLSYLNYGSDKRSTIPVKLAIKVLNEKALQYAIQYPGEDQHNAKERLKLSSDGTRINGYNIANREQTTDGTLILTTEGRGQDDNRSAEVQVIYAVAADRFSIRKNVRFKSSEAYINRNEYSLRR